VLFLLLDDGFDTLSQTTILLQEDTAKVGKTKLSNNSSTMSVRQLDDPRLFFFQGDMWVLFRNGKSFGFVTQLHNRLYFEKNGDGGMVVYMKASETVTSCCGRNMAMISTDGNDTLLQTVTWVDPVTVENVKVPPRSNNNNNISDNNDHQQQQRRKLRKQRKSDIHGTNGYMIPLDPASNELLGIAHFHRPENRDTSLFSLHGHHYTHAFFTISSNTNDKHFLRRIANEFLFESLATTSNNNNDGEVIQFASGIDIVTNEKTGVQELLVSYGVNDCESAVLRVDMKVVQAMLLEVKDDQEVVDLMAARTDLE